MIETHKFTTLRVENLMGREFTAREKEVLVRAMASAAIRVQRSWLHFPNYIEEKPDV
jgi:hypothetical protein